MKKTILVITAVATLLLLAVRLIGKQPKTDPTQEDVL